MSVYHWIVILLLIFAFFMQGWRRGNKAFIFVAMILLFCIMGLRDGARIGNDSRTSYRWQYNSMGNTPWEDVFGSVFLKSDSNESSKNEENQSLRDRSFGTKILMKLVYSLSDGDYQWFIAFVSVICLSAEAIVIKKYSPSPIQSVLYYLGLLYFIFQMSAFKQSIAMSLILLSFTAIIDRRPIRFVLLVLLAASFHTPALIFLPAYWIANMRIGTGYLLILAGVFFLTYFLRDRLVSIMSDIYYNSEMEITSNSRFLANKVIIMLAIIATALIVRPPDPEEHAYTALLQIIGVAAVIQTFSAYSNVFERLADYYFQFAVIFIPMVFERVWTRRVYLQRQTLNMVCSYGPFIFGSFAIWRFLDIITHDGHFYPFYFFFQ